MRIVEGISHTDHGLDQGQIDFIQTRYRDHEGFLIESFELPESLGDLPCGLHGPAMGDAPVDESEVFYAVRGSRPCESRLVNREPRPTRTLTVIMGGHTWEEDGVEQSDTILYTCFGGPLTPKEPGDPTLSDEQRSESETFWSQHALSQP